MSPVSRWFLFAVPILLAGLGCGGKDRLVRLEGIVTLNDEPVEGAIVSFLPDEAGGRFASGTTAKDGSFRLTTTSFFLRVKPFIRKATGFGRLSKWAASAPFFFSLGW